MKEFELEGDFIKLDQLLKAVSFASSGGEAKILMSELIKVNDQVATQRGKKIHRGDVVEYEGEQVKIV